MIEAKNRLIAKGDKWAEKVTQDHQAKQNKFMDDAYDWYGRNPLMSNDTTYGQINNNFTAGVVGSTYKITNPQYIAANAYSAAAHPLQTLDRININGQDMLNGVMGIADKIRNKCLWYTKITEKKRQNSLKSAREFPRKRRDILNPLYITIILYLSTTKDKGGKEDAHYVPNKSYQRSEQLWIPYQ